MGLPVGLKLHPCSQQTQELQMNPKSAAFSLVAAASVIFAAAAVAQQTESNITSTPGNGCTATANAMRGGNLSANPTNKACADAAAPVAAVPAQPAVVATPQPAPAAPMAAAPAPAAEPQQMAAAPALAPRADRN
jgi:hypothetical protein